MCIDMLSQIVLVQVSSQEGNDPLILVFDRVTQQCILMMILMVLNYVSASQFNWYDLKMFKVVSFHFYVSFLLSPNLFNKTRLCFFVGLLYATNYFTFLSVVQQLSIQQSFLFGLEFEAEFIGGEATSL